MGVVQHYSSVAPVFLIFGNADIYDDEVRKLNNKFGLHLPFFVNDLSQIPDVNILKNRFVNFNGVRIGGLKYFVDASWVREFKPANYNKRLSQAQRQTQKAQKVLNWFGKNSVDILLAHQPPYGILDKVGKNAPEHWQGKHAGSKIIRDYILRYSPRYVFCGHIHESAGHKKVGQTEVYNLGSEGDYKILEISK